MAAAQIKGSNGRAHPEWIRRGQIFTPLGSLRLALTVASVDREWAKLNREDGRVVRISVDRLLATDPVDGRGIHYRFQGWRQMRRGYRTPLEVVDVDDAGCDLRLEEWDPAQTIHQPAGILPASLRDIGAGGSCMADLSSPSAAGLNIHSCRRGGVIDASRKALPSYPNVLARRQQFRRLGDGALFQLLDGRGSKVPAWNGSRVVRIRRDRLLTTDAAGNGRYFEFLGGGSGAVRVERGRVSGDES